LWDHDLPVYPNVVSIERDGRTIPAAAQVTKTGYVFVLDLETGEPLFEVREQAVPTDGIDGEHPWPTQPIPTKPPPFAAQHLDESNVTDIAPANRAFVLERLKALRHGPAFLPPSLQGSVVIPGFHGGANWSGAAFDPETRLLYVNATNMPNIVQLRATTGSAAYRYEHAGYGRLVDQEGYPGIKPPWGELLAIDLSKGEIVWRSVLGEHAELTERGIPPTGTENFGGAIVTAGGLVFIAGTKDERIRAFDKSSGKELWQHPLPAGGYATPATYSAGGHQYVVIAAGGAGKLGTRAGDAFVAFALPR
jgi:quinoprotein glucose dehydrogenase